MFNRARIRAKESTMAATPFPETGFVRLKQIIGDRRAKPPEPGVFPVCASTWWKGCRDGRFPAPFKIGPATTVWKAEDIHALIERTSKGGAA